MSNTPTRPIRVDLELWARFGAAAEDNDQDRSAVLRSFMAWYARDPGARLPRRPAVTRSADGDHGGDVSPSGP